MLMSKTTGYAIRSVLFLADHSAVDKKVNIREVAKTLDIPFHFLGKIMQQLSRHHIILSTKGPGGGFYMTDTEKAIPMMKVFEIFEGDEYFHQCGLGLKECSESNPCPIHYQFKPFREYLHTALRLQSIEEWVEKVDCSKLPIRF